MPWNVAQVWGNVGDALLTGSTAANVIPNGDPFTSNTVSVRARWPGVATSVVWQNNRIKPGTIVQVTGLASLSTARFRFAHEAAIAGEVTIRRSSGSVADEEFEATILGTPP